jgi:hypothetical protein
MPPPTHAAAATVKKDIYVIIENILSLDMIGRLGYTKQHKKLRQRRLPW